MNYNQVFKSLEDAKSFYKLPRDELCLFMEDHHKSLERILLRGKIIYYIGEGPKLFPGYPRGNQMYYNQLPIIRYFNKNHSIYLFRKLLDGDVICMGKYTFQSIRKVISNSGFTYFEMKLYRIDDFNNLEKHNSDYIRVKNLLKNYYKV
jgi:hypothetical protein